MTRRRLVVLCVSALAVACDKPPTATPEGGGEGGAGDGVKTELPASEEPETGVDWLVSSMNSDADPCDSFYEYACGGWMKDTELPADKPRYTRSFSTVADANERVLKEILEESAERGDKMGKFYSACLDTDAVEKAGRGPIDPLLAEIDGIQDRSQLMTVTGKLHATVWGRVGWVNNRSRPPFLRMGLEADYKKDPKQAMGQLTQSGLGLPTRSMYLPKKGTKKLDEKQTKLLDGYRAHVARMLTLAGTDAAKAKADAEAVVTLETKLARAMLSPVQLRDDEANYHKVGFKGLKKQAQGADWDLLFDSAGLPKSPEINLQTPGYFKALAKQLKSAELETLKAYLRFHVMQATSPYLSKEIDDAGFALATLTSGVSEQPERWKRCADEAMWALGDLVGERYVSRRFGGESKAIADDMISRIYKAMETSLPTLTWMDETTRGRAVEKINAVGRKIGYPSRWKDYAEVEIEAGDYFGNAIRERRAHAQREMAKIGQPIDQDEWHMPTPLVNAYYNPPQNEIAFPAGIMQPPFFDAGQPNVMNFGGIGAVMGHELTHGFDDSGAKYDKDGFLRVWWERSAVKAFEERVSCVQNQYSAYEVLPGSAVKGELTSGENIADIGGVKEAYYAYKTWEAENEATAPVTEGMTNDQVFFVAWAQNWCTLATDDYLRVQVETDPHSPGRFRAEGPLADLPAFWEAFSCAEGTPMHPKNACEVW